MTETVTPIVAAADVAAHAEPVVAHVLDGSTVQNE